MTVVSPFACVVNSRGRGDRIEPGLGFRLLGGVKMNRLHLRRASVWAVTVLIADVCGRRDTVCRLIRFAEGFSLRSPVGQAAGNGSRGG